MQGSTTEPRSAPEGDAAVGARRRLQAVLAAQALAALGVHDPLEAELGEAAVHLCIWRPGVSGHSSHVGERQPLQRRALRSRMPAAALMAVAVPHSAICSWWQATRADHASVWELSMSARSASATQRVEESAARHGAHQAVEGAAAVLLAVNVLAVQARQAAVPVDAGARRAKATVQPAPRCMPHARHRGSSAGAKRLS